MTTPYIQAIAKSLQERGVRVQMVPSDSLSEASAVSSHVEPQVSPATCEKCGLDTSEDIQATGRIRTAHTLPKRIVMPIQTPHFTPGQFSATLYDSAAEKARCLNRLCVWLARGCPKEPFCRADKPLYHTLSHHLFGHVAEYDQKGFYSAWFSTTIRRLYWLRNALDANPCGNPVHTWSDAEKALQEWLRTSGIVEEFTARADEETTRQNKAAALRLLLSLSPEDREEVLAQIR